MKRSAFTLIEAVVFVLIGVVVILLALDLFTGSERVLRSAGRTAGAQVELQGFIETLAADVEELAYFQDAPPLEVPGGAAGQLKLAIVSNRAESGLAAAPRPELRAVTYAFAPSKTKGCSQVSRTVARLKPSGQLTEVVATGTARHVADALAYVKVVPFAWTPVPGTGWRLCAASEAKQDGAGAACISLTVKVSEPSGDALPGGDLGLTTRLWCRGRLLSLTREGRPL